MARVVKSSWDRLEEAIKAGDKAEALKQLDKAKSRANSQHESLVCYVAMAVTHLARSGEDKLEKLYRERYYSRSKEWIETKPGVKESVDGFIELMSNPISRITLEEEADRYVVKLDPCRTGGRLIRSMADGTARFDPAIIGKIKEKHPWTWNETGMNCYCPHSSLLFEIIPIELRGYPIAFIEYPRKPEDPCTFLFYKKPELIPEKYFARLGKKKTIK